MAQSSPRKLPPELECYTLFSRWDREESEAQRRQRALEELARAMNSKRAERTHGQA